MLAGVERGTTTGDIRARLRALDDHFTEHFELQSRMRSVSGPDTLTILLAAG
ncbi:hypothetical protein AB0G02_22590 [Actinosynnema sp. NPDC023658]|uniref:hypothetical protein n=1 Tax=Actinosynnema sp. NPDC023658 TaxID=3155465 RepID=UPI0033F77E5C